MEKERIIIGNKKVWPSDPYLPSSDFGSFVGREEE